MGCQLGVTGAGDEGWPGSVVTLRLDGVGALWLTASDGFLQERIYNASGFDQAPAREQAMIETFLGRTQRYNQRMMQAMRRLGLPCLNVEATSALETLTGKSLRLVGAGT